MPTHDFVDVGDVLGFDVVQGTIKTIDSLADTCVVTVSDTDFSALLFYHCSYDSELRDNGAIKGAASGFTVGDSVIVMKKIKDSPAINEVKVIGHTDGVRHCSETILFAVVMFDNYGTLLPKRAAYVFENGMDKTWTWKNGEVVDWHDSDFAAWNAQFTNKSNAMLESNRHYDVAPYKLNPELVNTDDIDYHNNAWQYAIQWDVGQSIYGNVLLPQTIPTARYTGFRTEKDTTNYPSSWPLIERRNAMYSFYAPLGLMHSVELLTGDDQDTIPDHAYYWVPYYADGDGCYFNTFDARYTSKSICMVDLLQYTIWKYHFTSDTDRWIFQRRVFDVQVQALFVPAGTKDYDWKSKGTNEAIRAKLLEAVELCYTLNGIAADRVRRCEIWIYIK